MMTEQDLRAIEARADAATPGPWIWRGGKEMRDIKLIGHKHWIVMDFVRQGMNGAQPRFLVGELLEKALDLLVPRNGQEHNAKWNSDIGHPDAQFLAKAREDIPALVAEVRRLRAQVDAMEGLAREAASRAETTEVEYLYKWIPEQLTAIMNGESEGA